MDLTEWSVLKKIIISIITMFFDFDLFSKSNGRDFLFESLCCELGNLSLGLPWQRVSLSGKKAKENPSLWGVIAEMQP